MRNGLIIHKCANCQSVNIKKYEDFDYWLYHKHLALPRLEIYKIDLCITGADHYKEGDFYIRQELINKYQMNIKSPKTLYAPVVKGKDNQTMGKSKGNAECIPLEKLIKLIKANKDNSEIIIV